MSGICEGRVVIVTGAARGIGREHALAFARAGAKVMVNDLGVSLAGENGGETPAAKVVREIEASGGVRHLARRLTRFERRRQMLAQGRG